MTEESLAYNSLFCFISIGFKTAFPAISLNATIDNKQKSNR